MDVYCVYYGLKSFIFVKVDVLLSSARHKRNFRGTILHKPADGMYIYSGNVPFLSNRASSTRSRTIYSWGHLDMVLANVLFSSLMKWLSSLEKASAPLFIMSHLIFSLYTFQAFPLCSLSSTSILLKTYLDAIQMGQFHIYINRSYPIFLAWLHIEFHQPSRTSNKLTISIILSQFPVLTHCVSFISDSMAGVIC